MGLMIQYTNNSYLDSSEGNSIIIASENCIGTPISFSKFANDKL